MCSSDLVLHLLLKHTVSHDDQEQVQNTMERLQRIRDDLLVAMFPKVGKK